MITKYLEDTRHADVLLTILARLLSLMRSLTTRWQKRCDNISFRNGEENREKHCNFLIAVYRLHTFPTRARNLSSRFWEVKPRRHRRENATSTRYRKVTSSSLITDTRGAKSRRRSADKSILRQDLSMRRDLAREAETRERVSPPLLPLLAKNLAFG